MKQARDQEWLLIIDEINRADLGRVLGEAIYLFEPREIAEQRSRSVALAASSGRRNPELQIPENLFMLGTMNSADRSTAILDLAVRRRFAFVDVWPDWDVVQSQHIPLAYGGLREPYSDIFSQQAPDDALVLMPGHAYFLAKDQSQLARRLRFELIPLLNEYLAEGRLGPCETELEAYLDWLHGALGTMARTKQSRKPIPLPEWQRRSGCLLRLEDQGRSVRIEPETFGIQSRDRSWNLFARDLISANAPQLEAVAVDAGAGGRTRSDSSLPPPGWNHWLRSPTVTDDAEGDWRFGSSTAVRLERYWSAIAGDRLDGIATASAVSAGAGCSEGGTSLGSRRSDPRTISGAACRDHARFSVAGRDTSVTAGPDSLGPLSQ